MSSQSAIKTELIDFASITLTPESGAPEMAVIREVDGFFLNTKFTSDFRIRKSVYDMLKDAQSRLPAGVNFMIYEAYRPLARQVALWDMATGLLQAKYPELEGQALRDLTETFVADPYNGIGSGHQAACALDISLCDDEGNEFDMGCGCQEISECAATLSDKISADAKENRALLVRVMHEAGFINYGSEWWHFSYGDHQWAYLTGNKEACFGPVDI